MPIPVTDRIGPTSPSDTYPTHEANYGKGGLHHVPDIVARNAITSDRRQAGMLVYVIDMDEYYSLSADLVTWVAASFGGGSDANYIHTQGVASNVWVVTHGLGKYPSITVVDSGGSVVEGDVEYDSINQVTLTFAAGFSGVAYLN